MRSDTCKTGVSRSSSRGPIKGAGITSEEIRRPFIGIANSYTNIFSGHSNLDKITRAVSDGIYMGGGLPVEFGTIAVCDAICQGNEGMKWSLPSREVIANSVESMVHAHCLDGIVLVSACDKITPGMLIGACRANVPAIIICAGPSLEGLLPGGKHGNVLEMKAKLDKGEITEDEYNVLEDYSNNTCGSCRGLFTANSMACITEALGMSLPGNGTIPAPYGARLRLAKQTGMRAVQLALEDLKPSDIITRESLLNAIRLDMLIGCSTNTTLHIPAIAGSLGYDVNLDDFDRISDQAPQIVKIYPSSKFNVSDLDNAGGISAVLKEAIDAGVIDGSQKSVTGKTLAENVAKAKVYNEDVIHPFDNAYSKKGGLAVLKGNIAPEESVIKVGAVAPEMHHHKGPARVYNSERAGMAALESGQINPGDVMVIRYEGPKGGPGMQEMLFLTSYICGLGMDKDVMLITDGRFSGASRGGVIGHVSPEAALGGPIALIEEGDMIEVDIDEKTINVLVSDEVLEERRKNWVCPESEYKKGWLAHYAKHVGSVFYGAQLD